MKALVVFIYLFNFSNVAFGESTFKKQNLPMIELGAGVVHGALADYPSSDEYRFRTIPFPYLVYRGDILKSDDRDGTRVELLKNRSFDLDMSFGGSFPTEGDKNQARRGMPNLDWTLEFGPRLLYYFYRNNQGYLRLGLPLRASISTDFQFTKLIGYTVAPTLQYDKYGWLSDKLDVYVQFTYHYLDEGLADYFYEIAPEFATNIRDPYNAQAGTQSFDSSLGFRYNFDSSFLLAGVRHSNLNKSANRESDLHRTDTNWSYVIAFGMSLYQSED